MLQKPVQKTTLKALLRTILERLLFVSLLVVVLIILGTKAHAEEAPDNGLPVVYVAIDETKGTIESMYTSPNHSVYCYGTIRIEVPEGFHYTDFPDLVCESLGPVEMEIRGRGNSSWKQAEKKPYKIKLDKKADVFGLGSNKHWALLANAFDYSLLRNRVTGWIGDQMGFDFTPRGVPVDLVMSGQEFGTRYLGSYYLAEVVRVDKNRLEIDELKESDNELPVITGGYLLQNALQVRAGSPDRFYTSRGVDWATHTPSFDTEEDAAQEEDDEKHGPLGENALETHDELGDGYENPVQQEYIQKHIQMVEDALFADGTGYRDLMDIESCAKYWLVNNFTKNNDAFATGSTYIYKPRDVDGVVSKIYWGPLWDFDFGYDRNYTVEEFIPGHLWMKAMLCDHEPGALADEIVKQWPVMKAAAEELLKEGGILDQYVAETMAAGIKDLELNHPEEETTYQEYVDKMRAWIEGRVKWMDEHINEVYDLVHKIRYVADGAVWDVEILESGEESKVILKRPEKEGFVFLGWADEDGNFVVPGMRFERDMTLTAQFISNEEATHAQDIVFRKTSDVVRPGYVRSYTIEYRVIPEDAQDRYVTWTSKDESLAAIDEYGVVTYEPLPEDQETVTFTFTGTLSNGVSRDFTLTVHRGIPPVAAGVTPLSDTVELTIGQQSGFTVVTDPDPANVDFYEYASENESVATVDDFGIITAVGAGETAIRLKAAVYDNGEEKVMEATMKVLVTEPEPETEPAETETQTIEPETQTAAPETETKATEAPEPEDGSTVKPLWFILGGAALLLIAGAVTAVILVRKKKNDTEETK